MEPILLPRLKGLPQAQRFPRADHERYLADHVIRRVLDGDKRELPNGVVTGGIGRLEIRQEDIRYRPMLKMPPGEVLKILIRELIGVEALGTCDCEKRAATMNTWGWLGCWRHRRQIISWLRQSATALQSELDEKRAMTLLQSIAVDGFLVLSRTTEQPAAVFR